MGERLTPRMKIGDVHKIGGLHVVCVPEYLITHVGMDPQTAGILLPPDAAVSLINAMRKAGLLEASKASARQRPQAVKSEQP